MRSDVLGRMAECERIRRDHGRGGQLQSVSTNYLTDDDEKVQGAKGVILESPT